MENRFSILVVDDDTGLAENLKDILELKGCSTDVAASGKDALSLFSSKIYDLALVDIKLPDIKGLELVEEITKVSPLTEYIIITGYASIESAVRAVKEKNIIAYETKPVDIEGVLSLIKQVDSRRQAEKALKQAYRNWQVTFDAIKDYVMLLSPEHEILEINEAGIQALQSNRKDIIGKKCYRLVHNQEFPIKECPCTRMVGSKKIEVSEYSERGRVYELTAWPILDENNELKAFAHIVKDITERKEMEKENEKMQNQLLQAQKMEAIGTLVGGVAHEINNPLTAISMNIALLADIVHRQSREHVLSAPVYEQAMKKINVIEGETNKTSGIVKSLLMLSRKSRGEKELTQVNMNNILNATLSIAENQLGLDNIHIVKELGTDLPDVTVNENQIGQVFLNLINNAHDAMLPVGGTLTIKTRCHSDPATAGEESRDPSAVPQDDKSGIIEISFSDTGYGISQEDLNKIFDPFFTTKEPGKGTGLGLSVSQNIIKNHKGEILVESKPGIGTTFTVRLPETAR